MKIEQISDYIHAEFLAVADPSTSIDDIFSDKNPDLLFERFEDRLIWYLLKSTSLELSVDGRSNQVIDELLWDEYHNGTPADQERITKQVKTALHNLYKARFIRRDRDNTVYLGSNIHIYRVYGHLPGYVQVIVASEYVEGECNIYEHHVLASGEPQPYYGDDIQFTSVKKLGPISRAMVIAQRLGDTCVPSDFPDEATYKTLKDAGWLSEFYGKVGVTHDFKVLEHEDNNQFLLEYCVNDGQALNES